MCGGTGMKPGGVFAGRSAMRWNFCGEGAEDGSCRIGAWRGSGGIGLAGFTCCTRCMRTMAKRGRGLVDCLYILLVCFTCYSHRTEIDFGF